MFVNVNVVNGYWAPSAVSHSTFTHSVSEWSSDSAVLCKINWCRGDFSMSLLCLLVTCWTSLNAEKKKSIWHDWIGFTRHQMNEAAAENLKMDHEVKNHYRITLVGNFTSVLTCITARGLCSQKLITHFCIPCYYWRFFLVWTGAPGMSWAHWQHRNVYTPQCQSVGKAGKPLERPVWDRQT